MRSPPPLSSITSVAVLGTYLPRRCGIATFTSDLATAISSTRERPNVSVLAVSDEAYSYPQEVAIEIDQDDPESFVRAAAFLNGQNFDVLSIQHEYGIFGGIAGENLLTLLRLVEVPVVTTLHTVLRHPSEPQRRVLDEVLDLSQRVVVMSTSAIELLSTVHKFDHSKIDFIPHGVPVIPTSTGASLREKMGGSGPVLLTFGLLSPDKGIQSVIRAMPGILEQFPDAMYHVVGVTHPHERARHGETYREGLQELARSLGVAHRVEFVNEFVCMEQLKAYLSATDFYLTPYQNPEQITSGTLAYAMAAGKVIVSTPYTYAQELLADGRGTLVPFADSEAITSSVLETFRDADRSAEMSAKALAFGNEMVWSTVGEQYARSFELAVRDHRPMPRLEEHARVRLKDKVCLDHVLKLTDDTGLIQHATFSVPNRAEGYCVDDNARALLLTVLLESTSHPSKQIRSLQSTYLSFVAHSFNAEASRFRNFMTYDRQWLEAEGSEDSQGRTIWALGHLVAHGKDSSHVRLAESILRKAALKALTLRSPRACAYAILGAAGYLEAHPEDSLHLRLVRQFGAYLHQLFDSGEGESWPWLEVRLSYANARIPQALMVAGQILGDDRMVERGLNALAWLMDHEVTECGCFCPVGAKGADGLSFGSVQFDQQPVEAWSSLSACITASKIRDEAKFLRQAERCFEWFLGHNVLEMPVGCAETGACHDGLQRHGLNQNQGAESTLAFLCSSLELGQALNTPRRVRRESMRMI